MSNINYEGELVKQEKVGNVTTLTIIGKINQIIEEEMIEETSAFEIKYRDGRKATITSDKSPALFAANGDEAIYDEDEIEEITRVESAQAASQELV